MLGEFSRSVSPIGASVDAAHAGPSVSPIADGGRLSACRRRSFRTCSTLQLRWLRTADARTYRDFIFALLPAMADVIGVMCTQQPPDAQHDLSVSFALVMEAACCTARREESGPSRRSSSCRS